MMTPACRAALTAGLTAWVAATAATAARADAPRRDSASPAVSTVSAENLQPNMPVAEMDTLVVTAMKSPATSFQAPYANDVVDGAQMDRRQYRSVPQALRDVPGVMVQETAVSHGSPYLRGFTSFRNLLLIDGIRLNNSIFRPGPNQYWGTVDPASIQRLEVVKGPSSVLYGSDAIGGTVNALTIDPYAYDRADGIAGRTRYRYATAEHSHAVRGELSLAAGDALGFVGGATYRRFGDLRGGERVGLQPNTRYDEWHADAKVEHFLQDNVRLVAAFQTMRQNNAPRSHRTQWAQPWNDTVPRNEQRRDLDQERQLAYVQLHATELDNAIDAVHASISWHRQSEVRDRIRPFGDGRRDLQGFDVNTLGIFAHAESTTPLGDFVYGFDYYRDWVGSFSSRNTIQGPVADDASYDLLGVFVQNTIHFGEQVDVTLGGRFTFAAVDAARVRVAPGTQGSIDEQWTDFSGNARVAWFIDQAKKWNLFGGVSQGFRSPNLSDLTRDADFGGGVETPAPGLDPENYLMFEIGGKTRQDNLSAQASFFHYLISDQILRVDTGPGAQFNKINADDGFMQGTEFGLAWRFVPELTLFGNFAYLDGEVQSQRPNGVFFDDYPSRIMPPMGQLGLRYESNNLPLWVEGQVHFAGDGDRVSQRDKRDDERIPPQGTPAYTVAHLRAGYEPTDWATVTVGLENITNEDYRVHGSGHNMPGINFVTSVELRY